MQSIAKHIQGIRKDPNKHEKERKVNKKIVKT